LSDDYESIEQIQQLMGHSSIDTLEILDRLQKLHKDNYVFLTLNMKFDRENILNEIKEKKQKRYWFGRTEKGYLEWQRLSKIYYKDNEAEENVV
jgi:hypothetical protein